MDTLIVDRHGIGGNMPPEAISPSIERNSELVATADKWITERPEILDEDTANKARDFVDQLRRNNDALDADHKAEKAPHKAAADAVDEKFRQPRAKVKIALDALKEKLGVWLKKKQAEADRIAAEQRAEAERKRKAAEEAARLAREAEQTKGASAIAAALRAEEALEEAEQAEKDADKGPAVARAAGNFSGRSMGLRTTWHARMAPAAEPKAKEANVTALLKYYAKHPAAREAMAAACLAIADKQAKADKRTDTAPPGVEFYSQSKAA